MNCSQTRKLLSAYVDGELFGREAADVAAHVEACPSCQLEFHDLTLVKDMVGRLPQVPAPSSLYMGVMARLQETAAVSAESRQEHAFGAGPARATSRRPAWLRYWKTGVAAAAVAAFTFAWGMKLLPSPPPLVADGGNSTVPPEQTLPGIVQPPEESNPAPEPDTVASEPVTEPSGPIGTNPTVNPGDAPNVPVTNEPDVTPPAGDPPAEDAPDAEEPDFGSRFGTAGAELPGGDRLVAKTMHVALTAADAEAFAVSLADLAAAYGATMEPGDDSAIRLRVPINDFMSFIDSVRQLGVPDTFKSLKNTETDVTEAVRNLTAERDYLQKAFADGDESVQEDLQMKEARLAEYFRDIEHLTIEITVNSLGS